MAAHLATMTMMTTMTTMMIMMMMMMMRIMTIRHTTARTVYCCIHSEAPNITLAMAVTAVLQHTSMASSTQG